MATAPLLYNSLYNPQKMGTFKAAVHERVLNEMLGSVNQGGWKVLILDDLTTRVLSSTLKVSDILDCNVSVVEDLFKSREPMPIPGIYFIQPTAASVSRLLEDFTGSADPLYTSVHIFFSSKVSPEALQRIKGCAPLLKCLRTLKEGNLEFLTVDSHTMVTEHPLAAVKLMGGQGEAGMHDPQAELDSIATRLCTLMSTLHEFPAIRYRQGRAPEPGDPPGAEGRRMLTDRLARVLDSKLGAMQQEGQLPGKDTCDLLILDRSYDPVAPIIHEWTYEAMVYDLLEVDENVYRYQPDSNKGDEKEREAVLGENDSLWVELRHKFIAEVYTTLAARFNEFQSKNRAAKQLGGGTGFKDKAGEMSTSNIRALIQALPQYRDVLAKLSLHIQMSSDLKQVTSHRQLTEVGELEQDLVLGEKNSKDLINFLAEHHDSLDRMDKMRLFMCYCATHPGKLDDTRQQQWMTLAKLSAADLAAVCNLAYMGVQVVKPVEKAGFFSSIKDKKDKEFLRKRKDDGNDYSLFRFEPLLKSILSNMSAGSLPLSEYPYLRPPAPSDLPANMRPASTRPTGLNWAKRGSGGEGGSAPTGRRLIAFIIGGAVRSEMRVVHELSRTLGRDVLLGSTSLETPESFVDTLYKLTV